MKRIMAIPLLLLCAGCAQKAAEAQAPAKPHDATQVTLANSALPSLKIEQVALENTPSSLTLTGKVAFDDERYARILSPVAGQVAGLRVRVADRVARGETLAFIRSRDAAAALNEHAEAMKDRDLAAKTYAMTRDLYAHDAASKMALDQSESDLDKAKARLARTSRSLAVLGLEPNSSEPLIPLRSSMGGVVVARSVTEGQLVQGDATPLFEIADLSAVWVLADVFERDVSRIRPGETADVTTSAYPNVVFPAIVARVSEGIDATTRTAKVRLVIANGDGRLKPEMFASVRVNIGENENALTIPVTALLVEDGKTYVFTRSGPSSFQRREVVTEPGRNGRVRVKNGLVPGESIVVDGALLLSAEQQKG